MLCFKFEDLSATIYNIAEQCTAFQQVNKLFYISHTCTSITNKLCNVPKNDQKIEPIFCNTISDQM